jgi:hypothetical protein
MVKAKKEITERGKQRSGNGLSTVIVKLAFLEGVKPLERLDKNSKIKRIQDELESSEIELNPYKFDLAKEEEIMVQPVIRVGEDGRRTKFQKSIFDDTWATVKIPAKPWRKWKKDNKDIIKARKQENKKRGRQ